MIEFTFSLNSNFKGISRSKYKNLATNFIGPGQTAI
jgi:hypothetical protein